MWADQFGVRVNDAVVGVRVDDAHMAKALRSLCGAAIEPMPERANYSLVLGEPDGATGARAISRVYRGSCLAVRARDARALVDAATRHIATRGDFQRDDVLVLTGVALVHDGRAVVAPPWVRDDLARTQPRLLAAGITMVEEAFVKVDAERLEVEVSALPFVATTDAATDLDALGPDEASLRHAAPGRYPLVGVLLEPALWGDLGVSARVAALAARIVNADARSRVLALAGLVNIVRSVPSRPTTWDSADLVAATREFLRPSS